MIFITSVKKYEYIIKMLIFEMKKTFFKCPKRIEILKEKYPGLPNPPRPATTRWWDGHMY